MAYTKQLWVDRNIQYPSRYTDELGNTKTFTPSPGTITQAGTTVTAARMNNIENGIESALNPSYSATQISTSEINTLPSTSQGLLDEMVVKGRTTVNLLPDAVAGCESTSGWSTYQAAITLDSANKLEGTNCIKLTTNGSGQMYRNIFDLIDPTKHYLYYIAGKSYNLDTGIVPLIVSGPNTYTGATITNSSSYKKSGILLSPSLMNGITALYVYAQAVGVSGQYGFVDELYLVEISATDYALGVPALLDKYTWHLGVKSVDKMRIKSLKNVFDISSDLYYLGSIPSVIGSNSIKAYTNRVFAYGTMYKVKVIPNIPYTLSATCTVGGVATASYLMVHKVSNDLYGEYGTIASYGSQSLTFTPTDEYILLEFARVGDADNTTSGWCTYTDIQLELGTVATKRESHQQSSAVCNLPLRGVLRATDSWDAIRGKHVQNLEKHAFLSSDIEGMITSTTNIDYAYTKVDSAFSPTSKDWLDGVENTIVEGYPVTAYANLDNVSSIGKYLKTGNRMLFPFAKGTSLATARTTLTGVNAYYQLATPITTYLQPSVLSATANGTIYQERFVEDYGFYNSGLSLTDSTKLITNLVEVRKWNINDGSYVIMPNSSVTVTSGVITAISGAINGEFYTWDFNYDDSLSLNGELNYSYPVNMAGQVELNSNNIVNLDKKIDDKTNIIPTLSARIDALDDNTKKYGTSIVGTDSYSITTNYKYASYNTGMNVYLKADVSNTGACTINVDGLGVKNIKVFGSAGKIDTKTGDIIASGIYLLIYDGTDFILSTPNSILQSIVTARGDIIRGSGANVTERLALGSSGKALISNGTDVVYGNPSDTVYTPSDNSLMSYAPELSISGSVYSNVKTFTLARRGGIRVKFEGKVNSGSSGYLGIFNNSDTLLIEIAFGGTSYSNQTFDLNTITLLESSLFAYKIKLKHSGGNTVYVKNISICADETNIVNEFI